MEHGGARCPSHGLSCIYESMGMEYRVHLTQPRLTWNDLLDLQPQILNSAAPRVVYTRGGSCPLPADLRPKSDFAPHKLSTKKTYSFERPRKTIFVLGDTLTVTFSNCVDLNGWAFGSSTGWKLDKNAICTQLNQVKVWSGVSKICLYRDSLFYKNEWYFKFVLKGKDGEDDREELVEREFSISENEMTALKNSLEKDLQLKSELVEGDWEFAK